MTKKQNEIIEMMKSYEEQGLATCRQSTVPVWEMKDGRNVASAFVLEDKLYMSIKKPEWLRSKDLTRGYDSFKKMTQKIANNLIS